VNAFGKRALVPAKPVHHLARKARSSLPAKVAISAWWLRSHRLGPLEWLWRSFTYGALLPR
jgi:hypothetical protein